MSEHVIETWTAGRMSETDFCAACALHHAAFPKPGRTLADVIAQKRPVWMSPPPEAPEKEVQAEAGSGGRPVSELSFPGVGALFSDAPPVRYAVRDAAGRWLGNAGTLTRTLGTTRGPMRVLGLLDVATLPETRGRGLGAAVVRAAWGPVDAGRVSACLFETGEARAFYEKLGARVIDNPLVNTLAEGGVDRQPFADPWAMIYPAEADWPTGEIDLRGPGF